MELISLMNRLLTTGALIALSLWTLTSLAASIRPKEAAELKSSLLSGDTAALALLKAAHPEALTIDLMQRLATHQDLKLRELTAHQAWTPQISLEQQIKVVQSIEPDWVRERGTLWLTRRATSQNTLTLNELETYWSSK